MAPSDWIGYAKAALIPLAMGSLWGGIEMKHHTWKPFSTRWHIGHSYNALLSRLYQARNLDGVSLWKLALNVFCLVLVELELEGGAHAQ